MKANPVQELDRHLSYLMKKLENTTDTVKKERLEKSLAWYHEQTSTFARSTEDE